MRKNRSQPNLARRLAVEMKCVRLKRHGGERKILSASRMNGSVAPGREWRSPYSANLQNKISLLTLEVEERLAEEARVRRLAGLKQNQSAESLTNELPNGAEIPLGNYLPNDDSVPLGNGFIKNKAAVQAAFITGTNKQYVKDAKKIRRRAPETITTLHKTAVSEARFDFYGNGAKEITHGSKLAAESIGEVPLIAGRDLTRDELKG